ncbi:hypothetical protein Belba_0382 [Belliella baltica DSM 15883]|uniref:DUF3575 domain-containing protein n=1 Tax=Belliella baltica (strain DSM 15883 / CIP 108006 / LMG 21964 / BA134) TaxID=866536 RepID=I3Z1C7_BELBD|nr:hypothetical protein [Belliella baltica]AFL83045.1 hypothetical protein Belba_0382 [Belliella baltica DSM 15883]
MKKIVLSTLVFFLIGATVFAQTEMERDHSIGEVKLNFLNTILLGSVEFGYEHFIAKDQSIGIEAHFNDRFAYVRTSDSKEFDATSILASYNFYFEGDETGKLYIFPFVKYRFGEYTEISDGILNTVNMNSFLLGLGGGYKWVFNDKFAFGPYASIARGFSEEVNDQFAAVEFKAGFSVGYRF